MERRFLLAASIRPVPAAHFVRADVLTRGVPLYTGAIRLGHHVISAPKFNPFAFALVRQGTQEGA